MAQQIINTGAVANDGTGDPLRTAFTETNNNFTEIYTAGPVGSNVRIANNTILTLNTNGNLVLAPNGIGKVVANVDVVPNTANIRNLGSSTQRWSTVYTQYLNVTNGTTVSGDLTVGGNLTVTGDIIQIGNIITDAKTIQLANTAANANAANGAGVTVGANDDIATLLYNSTGNVWTTNIGVSAVGNVTAPYFIGDGSQLLNIPVGNNGAVQVAWLGKFSNQGGTPDDTYSTLQFDSDGMPTLDGTSAYQQRVDYSPYLQVLAPEVESTDYDIVAGPGITVVGYDDNYNTPRSAYLSVQDQANATQQWDFGILGNGSNNFSIQDRTGNQVWSFGTDGNINIPGLAFNINYANSESATLSPSVGNSGAVQFNWQGSLSNQGGTPGDTYSTMQFDSDGLLNVNGTTAYQPRVDYTPYVTVNTPRVESTDFDVVAGPGITVVGYDDNYNIPRSAYMSVQDQATATQQWDFGILGNGSNAFSVRNRTTSTIPLAISTDGTVTASTIITNDISSDDSSFVTIQDGLNVVGDIETRGNVTADYFIGDGSQLTGLPEQYGNSNVATFLAVYGSNTIVTTGNVSAGNVLTSAQVVASGVIQTGTGFSTGGYLSVNGSSDLHDTNIIGNLSVNVIQSDDSTVVLIQDGVEIDGDAVVNGNVTADYFIGNGSQLTGISTANTGNVTFDDVNIIGTGNLNLQPNGSASEYLNIYLTGAADIHVAYGGGSGNVILGTDEQANVAVLLDGNVAIQAGNVGGTKTWNFDTAGNLTLPMDSVVYETNIPDGALSGSAIALKPTGGTTANQQLLIYPTANDGDHIHLTSGNLYTTELFLGSDNFYVKLANTGNIIINSNDSNSSNAMWTFDTTGNLTLPANAFAINYANGTQVAIGGGGNANTGNVTFSDQILIGTGSNDGSGGLYLAPGNASIANSAVQYLRVRGGDVATHIHLDTGNNQFYDQYFGDDAKYVKLANTGNVVIGTDDANGNQYSWTFGTDGNLTTPSNLVIGPGPGSGSRIFQYDEGLEIVGEGANSVVQLGWTANTSAPDSVTTIAMNYPGGGEGNILIAVGNNATTVNYWLFDNTGNLTAPGSISAVGNVQAGNITTVGLISSTGNVTGGNILTAGIVSATGNVSGNFFIGNGSQLTGIAASYGNANVSTFLAAFGSNAISTTGNVTASNFVGNISITGNVVGTQPNVTLVAGSYSTVFDNTGNLTLPGNTFAVNYANNTPVNPVTKFESSWTVPVGNSTQSFTVAASETYYMWVDCNIPNGILVWNATGTVTNTNVPVVGYQYAWVYNGGGTPIDFTSIPNQFIGTANAIVRSNVAPSATTNRFDFGINNTSGGNVTVRYGWIAIS